MTEILPVKNLGRPLTGVENVLHTPIPSTVMADGGNVGCELVGSGRQVRSRLDGTSWLQYLRDPRNGRQQAKIGLTIGDQPRCVVRADARDTCQNRFAGGIHIDQPANVLA